MQIILALAFAALAVASPVELVDRAKTAQNPTTSPGASNIILDVGVTGQDLSTLASTFNLVCGNCTYSGPQLGYLLGNNSIVRDDLRNTSTAVNASSPFNNADTASIANAYQKLIPTVSSALNVVATHQPGVTREGIQSVVIAAVQQQRELSREIVNALISRGSGPSTTVGPKASATLMSLFNSALAVYSTS